MSENPAPDAQECVSYGMPAFKGGGKTVAAFASFKNCLSFLPQGGSVIAAIGADIPGYRSRVDQPESTGLVWAVLMLGSRSSFVVRRGRVSTRHER